MCIQILIGLDLLSEFNLESQNENFVRRVPSEVTYCKEKKKSKIFCIVKMSRGQLPRLS